MRSILSRFRRPYIAGLPEQLMLMNSTGDGSTLTLDFTTGVLDPRLTFTRGSNATFINSSGLVQWSASNHAPRTNWNFTSPTGTGWNAATVSGTGTFQWVGNGTVIAASGSAGQALTIITTPTGIAEGLRYVMSVTASSVTGSPTIQSIFDFTSASGNTYFKNGAAATAGTTVASGDRISVSAIASATSMNVRIGCGAWFANRTNESVTLTQFHWHPGSAPVAYYENTGTSPRYDSARFDHDPSTGAPRGLLIEGSATNLLPNSQTLSGTGWFTGGICTRTSNYATGPDGIANSATRLEMSFSGGVGRTYYDSGYTTLPQTMSVWLKSNTGSNQTVNLWNTSGTPVSCTVTPTWKRFQSVSTTGSSLPGYFYFENPSTTVAVDILAWGAQLEAGSGASSYIPTGASTATRIQDQMQMTNLASLGFNTNAGTMTINGTYNKDANAFPRSIRFMGSSVQSMAMITAGKTLYGNAPNTSGGTYFDVFRALSSFGAFKYGFSLTTATSPATGLGVISLNGSSTSITPLGQGAIVNPVTLDFLYGAGAPTDYPSMNVASMKYWPYAMTSAQLNAMTT